MDGQVIERNLAEAGLSREWLMAELARQGVSDPGAVFHAELSTDGKLYVDRRQDGVGVEHDPSDIG